MTSSPNLLLMTLHTRLPYSILPNPNWRDSSRSGLRGEDEGQGDGDGNDEVNIEQREVMRNRKKGKGEWTHPSPPIQRSSLSTLNLSSPSAALTLSLTAPVILSTSSRERWTAMNSDSGSCGVWDRIWRMRSGYRVIRCTGR